MERIIDDGFFKFGLPAYDILSTIDLLHVMTRVVRGVPYPIAIVSATGEIEAESRRMTALLDAADGFRRVNGRLEALNPNGQLTLRAAIQEICSGVQRSAGANEVIVPIETDSGVCLAKVRSLAAYSVEATLAPFPAVVSLEWQVPRAALTTETLMDLFKMSSREAAVAGGLLDGKDTKTMARELGVGVSTVRSDIKSLLRVTGCRRREELVTILGQLRQIQ